MPGWTAARPTGDTHTVGTDLGNPHGGKGCGVITGTTAANGARAALVQEFYGKTALPAGQTYRYTLSYRTEGAGDGSATVLVDCYTAAGESGYKGLVSLKLPASAAWRSETGEFALPEGIVRTRMLLYLRGAGKAWYDDVALTPAAEPEKNLLRNGGFEPPSSYVYDLAPTKDGGPVQFSADFDNGTLGRVKAVGPDEFYLYAFPEGKPISPQTWFHFKIEGCAGREVTFHLNPAPYSRKTDWGYDARTPVMSYDGDTWVGIEDKSWSDDGSLLTFRQRFTQSPAWIAYFYPYAGDHITHFLQAHAASPYFASRVLGQTKAGRPLRMYSLTDPAVPEANKRAVLLTTLQHDIETTGAWALEGIARFVLSDDPRAAALRRAFVFYIVPRLDVDGAADGNLYTPPGVGNMNRQWGLDTVAEVKLVEAFARELAARGQRLELFMDFHGWCTPERTTLFMTFGREISSDADEADATRLADMIRQRLTGKVHTTVWRHMEEHVTDAKTDLRRLAPGWMKYEAGARLAYSIEIFGEPTCTQEGYLQWGQSFAEGFAEFAGCGR
ncbi:M14-type cytosolic carboxypeptidase [bacterium]|nr:M14-type cytosolic carboxypeptidase [bacterium]